MSYFSTTKNHDVDIDAYLAVEDISGNEIEIFINEIFRNIRILHLANVIQKRNENLDIADTFRNDNLEIVDIFKNESEIFIIIGISFDHIFINNRIVKSSTNSILEIDIDYAFRNYHYIIIIMKFFFNKIVEIEYLNLKYFIILIDRV